MKNLQNLSQIAVNVPIFVHILVKVKNLQIPIFIQSQKSANTVTLNDGFTGFEE